MCSRSENVNGRGYYQRNPFRNFNTKDAHVWNEQPMVLDHKEVEATKVDLWII
jgi:hypothetical protein